MEVTINQIFLKVYYSVGSDTIFNLRNIPNVKFIKLKIDGANKSNFKVTLIYQVLLSLALAFFLLITLEEFFLKKKIKKLKNFKTIKNIFTKNNFNFLYRILP